MAPALEHDYIRLSEVSDKIASSEVENLRETELRLGLPGSLSPERKEKAGLTLGLQIPKGFAAGAKRGFYDAIDENSKWIFSGIGGSEGEMEKGGALFSPRGGGGGGVGGGGGGGGLVGGGGKEVAGKAVSGQEKKAQGMPAAKAQVVGWPPIRSYRKNTMSTNPSKNKEDGDGKHGVGCLYVKVSMDGAPYLRKVDLRTYCSYKELSSALEKMFSGFTIGQCRDGLTESCLMDLLNGSEYVLTYEDKDGDWMLVGDVPWKMFIDSCRRLRIMKGSDAIGLAPKAMEKNKNQH